MTKLLASSALIAGGNASAQTWTPSEMIKMKAISDVQISPKNTEVLFVASGAVLEEETGVNIAQIYKTSSDGAASPITPADRSSGHPRYSPSGEWIAYLSENENKIKNVFLIPASGGEARVLTNGMKNVQVFSWSPDSQTIAFVMEDETEQEKTRKKTSKAYLYKEGTVINRFWLINVVSGSQPQAVTSDEYYVRGIGDFGLQHREFTWSPDGKTIVFAYSPAAGFDAFHLESSLASLDLMTGIITPWKKNSRYEAVPRFSSDGETVAYLSDDSKQQYSFSRSVAIRSAKGTNLQKLAPIWGEGISLGATPFLEWDKEGKNLLVLSPKGTKNTISIVPVDGSPASELATGDTFFNEPILSYDKTMLGMVVQSPCIPPEACVTRIDAFAPKKVSHLNKSFLSFPQTRTEALSWKSVDGLEIEGLVTYPIQYQTGKQYPLLLVIHGGPQGCFDETFTGGPSIYPLAAFAEAGFVILRTNPRGSCGYGRAFLCANYEDWGGKDFQDIMAGVDALIAKGMANPDKMGVMGWSYGGYMTKWTVTQTSRFKAASMGAGLSNLVSMAGTSDVPRFLTDYFGDTVDNFSLYQERSPLYFASQVTTPCLIQHGTDDKRVPVGQSYEFYNALERAGQKPMLVLYPGMGHRLPDPNMLLSAMETNFTWFQAHLQGE